MSAATPAGPQNETPYLAPVRMQLLHLLLADLVWITLVLLAARELCTEGGRA